VVVTGQQRSRGAEIDLNGEILPGWRAIAGVGFLDAEVTRDIVLAVGNRLRGIPRWSGNLWTTYHVRRGAVAGLIPGGGVTYVGRRAGNLQDSHFISG